ncbi:putative transposase [Escherichia coli DEC14C]|nr:putative transposase [Escherichia coli DEC14C]
MRKSFNGLGEQIQHVLDDNPFSGHLFIFRGRRGEVNCTPSRMKYGDYQSQSVLQPGSSEAKRY